MNKMGTDCPHQSKGEKGREVYASLEGSSSFLEQCFKDSLIQNLELVYTVTFIDF